LPDGLPNDYHVWLKGNTDFLLLKQPFSEIDLSVSQPDGPVSGKKEWESRRIASGSKSVHIFLLRRKLPSWVVQEPSLYAFLGPVLFHSCGIDIKN